ncbi:hypothetical protein PIROE2DRAFT_6089 [Piromyces sp. E2]|nr:hypothetical protein PIROE2DRAFT_6089 [Piromyces sp. E2]|eukprot:OUM66668.1 hypothetical protein PIROE2DRAFT_6089 [Piromyces sp. E2]
MTINNNNNYNNSDEIYTFSCFGNIDKNDNNNGNNSYINNSSYNDNEEFNVSNSNLHNNNLKPTIPLTIKSNIPNPTNTISSNIYRNLPTETVSETYLKTNTNINNSSDSNISTPDPNNNNNNMEQNSYLPYISLFLLFLSTFLIGTMVFLQRKKKNNTKAMKNRESQVNTIKNAYSYGQQTHEQREININEISKNVMNTYKEIIHESENSEILINANIERNNNIPHTISVVDNKNDISIDICDFYKY